MIRDEIINLLYDNQDLEYKKFNERICWSKYPMIGVRIPIIKKIAKNYTKKYGIDLFDQLKDEYYEEVLIKGLILGYIDKPNETYIKKFVPLIDNWAICDTTISNMKNINSNLEKYYLFINNTYRKSTNEFDLRFLIVTYLDYYIKEDYIDDILKYIDTVKSEAYYVKMAIAWFISIAYIKEKDKTKAYLNKSALDNFTYNKALQKICESYQVTKEEKLEIKKLKRS